jgi:hypothetical protein
VTAPRARAITRFVQASASNSAYVGTWLAGVSVAAALSACVLPEVTDATSVGTPPSETTHDQSTQLRDASATPVQPAANGMDSGRQTDAAIDMSPNPPPTDAGTARGPEPADAGSQVAPSVDASTAPVDTSAPAEPILPDPALEHAFAQWPMPDSTQGSLAAPSYVASAETVLDTVTNLVWQRTLPALYEGCTGKFQDSDAPGTACFLEEAKKYCASPALADALGGSGWRVPTLIELVSLLDVNRPEGPNGPMIDTAAFPQTPNEFSFISATSLMIQPASVGAVSFGLGFVQPIVSWGAGYVRCVR